MSILLEKSRLNPISFQLTQTIIKIDGADAKSYLNSQTTNNVEKLSDECFQMNSILDLSGKIISSFLLCRENVNVYYIILKDEFVDSTIERIEKYHISEDFEVEMLKKSALLKCNTDGAGFKGTYFFENDSIVFDETCEDNKNDFDLLKTLTGVPELGSEVLVGTLINNTRFDELSVDYTKGCFPGQEPVSKINTRRGAAYKPVLFKSPTAHKAVDKKVYIEGKKAGEVLSSATVGENTYYSLSLLREHRVNHSEVTIKIDEQKIDGIVLYYPYISPLRSELATDLYDSAVEYFQNNDNDNAISYFKKAIEVNPKFEDAYESLGVLYGRLNDYETAIELMTKLNELNPKSMMAYTNLSLFNMKIGNIDIAEKFKSEATFLNFEILGDEAQKKKEAENLAAKKLAERDRREGMFVQVLEMDVEDAMANNGMGEIEFERGNFSKAQMFFECAIKSNPKYSVAYLGLGKSLYHQHLSDQAREVFSKGIEVAGKNGDLMPANEMQSLITKI